MIYLILALFIFVLIVFYSLFIADEDDKIDYILYEEMQKSKDVKNEK